MLGTCVAFSSKDDSVTNFENYLTSFALELDGAVMMPRPGGRGLGDLSNVFQRANSSNPPGHSDQD